MIKKIWFLLNKKYRIYGFFLICILLISSILETFSIALIVPVVDVIFNNNESENFLLSQFFKFFSFDNKKDLIITVLIIFFLTFLIKNIFLLLFAFLNTSYVNFLRLNLCSKLFEIYTQSDFQKITNENKSLKIRNIQNEVGLVSKTIYQILNVLNEILVIFVIGILLIYSDPKSTFVSLLIVFFSFFILSYSTKNILRQLGLKRANFANISTKSILDFFEGLKQIKIFGKDYFFKKKFIDNEKKLIRLNIFTGTLKAFPRLYYEAIAIVIISTVIYLNISIDDKDSVKNLGKFALFLAAAIRIMPSFNRLSQAFQNISYHKKSIDIINDEFRNIKDRNVTKNQIDFKNKIEFLKVGISYNKKEIIKDFNKVFYFGEKYLIKGPNGSGKSTLLNCLMGISDISNGKILIDEKNYDLNKLSWKKTLGFSSNENFFYESSIAENIAFGVNLSDVSLLKIDKLIDFVELKEFISNQEKGVFTQINQSGQKLSEGEKQKIALARSLYNDPSILILDEAFSSIDEKSMGKIMEKLFIKKNLTVIYISHDKDFSKFFDSKNIIHLA